MSAPFSLLPKVIPNFVILNGTLCREEEEENIFIEHTKLQCTQLANDRGLSACDWSIIILIYFYLV